MTPTPMKEIKKMMVDMDISLKTLAERAGYSRVHVSNIVHGRWKSPKARQAIAGALGVDPQTIWPDWENHAGTTA